MAADTDWSHMNPLRTTVSDPFNAVLGAAMLVAVGALTWGVCRLSKKHGSKMSLKKIASALKIFVIVIITAVLLAGAGLMVFDAIRWWQRSNTAVHSMVASACCGTMVALPAAGIWLVRRQKQRQKR